MTVFSNAQGSYRFLSLYVYARTNGLGTIRTVRFMPVNFLLAFMKASLHTSGGEKRIYKMNTFKRSFTVLLFGLIGSCCFIATSNAAGFIKVREGDGVRECSIPAIPGDYLVRLNGCTNDQAYTVRFVDVPSALHVTFFDNSVGGYCQKNSSWEIEVRTIKNPTTTPADDYISLAAMYSVPDNTLVVPGILKIRTRTSDGPINGRLTCVRVEEGK